VHNGCKYQYYIDVLEIVRIGSGISRNSELRELYLMVSISRICNRAEIRMRDGIIPLVKVKKKRGNRLVGNEYSIKVNVRW